MNTELKEDTENKTGYSFENMVKATENLVVEGYKKLKVLPPPTAFIADDIGMGVAPIPNVDGLSNSEVMNKMGVALAHNNTPVKGFGVVCEAYVSKRTDIAPSKDPKAKEVLFMAFGDSEGKKALRVYTKAKGKLNVMKGMNEAKFTGLVDEFWNGYKSPVAKMGGEVKPTLC